MSTDRFELEPLPSVYAALPGPEELKRQLLDALDIGYNALIKERGKVTRPEDTFPAQRALAASIDSMTKLKKAFEAGIKYAQELADGELKEAVGEQDGIANQALTVPDADGDIRIAPSSTNVHRMDVDQLVVAVAVLAMAQRHPGLAPLSGGKRPIAEVVEGIVNGDSELPPEVLPEVLAELTCTAMYELMEMGKFEPQVSKVRAYAAAVARDGNDELSSVISSAIKTTRKSTGVKVERKAPK